MAYITTVLIKEIAIILTDNNKIELAVVLELKQNKILLRIKKLL